MEQLHISIDIEVRKINLTRHIPIGIEGSGFYQNSGGLPEWGTIVVIFSASQIVFKVS